MSETCVVCKQGKGPEKCEICGFSDSGVINRKFVNIEDGNHWLETVVGPYRIEWEKNCLARIKELESQLGAVKNNETSAPDNNDKTVKRGAVIEFGKFLKWRVLDIEDKKALLITDTIIGKRQYHDKNLVITWDKCTLQKYLNCDFIERFFSEEDKKRIVNTKVTNPDNLWYGVKCGTETTDKIFLLSLEEADKYFGNSGDYLIEKRKNHCPAAIQPFGTITVNKEFITANNGSLMSNENNADRIAKYEEPYWWWLRSVGSNVYDYNSGSNNYNAACVNDDGSVNVKGRKMTTKGGVRPALWLQL